MKNKAQMLLYSCRSFILLNHLQLYVNLQDWKFEIRNFFSLTGICLKEEQILAFGMVILLLQIY